MKYWSAAGSSFEGIARSRLPRIAAVQLRRCSAPASSLLFRPVPCLRGQCRTELVSCEPCAMQQQRALHSNPFRHLCAYVCDLL